MMTETAKENWFYESIRKYENLYMYDLQNPVTSAVWIHDRGLCVAIRSKVKNEVLELSFPDRMLVTEEKANLMKDRDFCVESGGYVEDDITSLSCLPNTQCLVSSTSARNGINILQIGRSEKNLITEIKSINNSNPESGISSEVGVLSGNEVVFGSGLNDICLADVQQGVILMSLNTGGCPIAEKKLSRIIPLDDSTSLICGKANGNIFVIDKRDRKLICDQNTSYSCFNQNINSNLCYHKGICHWTMCLSSDNHSIFQISSSGDCRFVDTRMIPKQIIIKTELSVKESGISLSCSPSRKHLATSGFDGNVQIFNINNLISNNDTCVKKPDFIHHGHTANSGESDTILKTLHLWYPDSEKEFLLSAASDGSLHAWKPTLLT